MATGVSIRGQQTLEGVAVAPSGFYSVAITSQPLPPIRRVGYFYLYQYRNATPFQCFIVDDGRIRAPGLWRRIAVPLFAADYRYRLDVIWEVPGLNWTSTFV